MHRLLADCLPGIMRQPRIYALLRVLCSQIGVLHDSVQSWRAEAQQRASYTWQVASIERAVYEQMGTAISIDIMDGEPYDFRVAVEVPGDNYDEGRLRAIIDLYRPAARRYVIEGSDTYYKVQYEDHVCERQDVEYTAAYGEYVCEREEIPRIDNYISLSISPVQGGRVTVSAIATYDVTSQLTVTTDSGIVITIRQDAKEGWTDIDAGDDPGEIYSVDPEYDDRYNYIY